METTGIFDGSGFDEGSVVSPVVDGGPGSLKSAPRLRRPDRHQMTWEPCCLEERIPLDHPVRTIWAVVQRLELSAFYAVIEARGSEPGRAATDPRLLVALWLYAAVEGVGNGRELDRLCRTQDAYQWLCGGVSVNYHTLNDFRVSQEKALDALFTNVLAILMSRDLVQVKRVSQDGTRIRAAAGSSSFRREPTLQRRLEEAKQHVEALKRQAGDSAAHSARQRAAQERAARAHVERIEAALGELPKIEKAKAAQKAKPSKSRPARVSTTDAEARVMKMSNGGFNPAYNVQIAADTESRAILGVDVTNAGSDAGMDESMRRQIEERTGRKVEEHLLDGGFVRLEGIARAEQEGVTVYAPVPAPKKAGSAYEVRKGDSPAVAAWRRRMGSEAGKEIYKQRAATSETVNADLKAWRGLSGFRVRGRARVRCVVLWSALAYNILHFTSALTG